MKYPLFVRKIYKKVDRFIKKSKRARKKTIPFFPPKTTYKHLICLQGFGNSGSGAILDFLSEFNNITTLGFHDEKGGATQLNKKSGYEFDFLRNKGGIFDLMTAFTANQNNLRIADCKIKDFITLSEFNYRKYGGYYNDKYLELTNAFIERLVDFKNETFTGLEGNWAFQFNKNITQKDYANLHTPYEFNHYKKRYRYFLKKLSVDEYLKYANEYVTSFLKTIESKEYMVLDQFLSDYCANFDFYKNVIGDYKLIAVHRDPRDVYATGCIDGTEWIDRNPEIFVKWYKFLNNPYINVSHPNFLLVRFEDFILNHEKTVDKISKFLEIDLNHHINKNKYLKLEKSSKNIGLYKTLIGYDAEIEYIQKELSDYCYKC